MRAPHLKREGFGGAARVLLIVLREGGVVSEWWRWWREVRVSKSAFFGV